VESNDAISLSLRTQTYQLQTVTQCQKNVINVSAGEECRIALLDDGRLKELYMERNSATSHVGNVYKGKSPTSSPPFRRLRRFRHRPERVFAHARF
jgi:hypothetical protein